MVILRIYAEHPFLSLTTFMVKGYPDSGYFYVNIKCQLKIVFKDSCSNFLTDIDNLMLMPDFLSNFYFSLNDSPSKTVKNVSYFI